MHHPASYLIGLDLGTSVTKGVLMRDDGTVLLAAERPATYSRPAPNQVETDAHHYWLEITAVIRELAADAPAPVRALAFAAASGNTLLADEQGEPLTPIINWMDTRCVGCHPAALHGLEAKDVRQVVGWPCVDIFPLAHLAWLRENRPQIWSRAAHLCMSTDWLLHRLTGNWLMDYSTATTFHLQDQERRRWHQPYLERLDVSTRQLSRLVPSGTVAGPLTPAAAAATGLTTATLAVAGCFDHPAAARAVGVTTPGQLLLSCGTSWVGFFPDHNRQRIVDAELLCDPFLSAEGGPWGAMFSVPTIGPTIDWYVDNLIAPGEPERLRIFDELAATAKPGANGLVVDVQAPPRRLDGDRASIARAVMEGAARALDGHLRRLRERGQAFTRAVQVGGPSKSPIWPRIIEEITGLTIAVGTAHAGARGAAMLAAQAVGSHPKTSMSDPSDSSDLSDKSAPPRKEQRR